MKKLANRLLAIITILALFTGCMPPNAEEIERAIQQTQTAEKTIAPKPTITPAPTKPLCQVDMDLKSEWQATFCDTFEDNRNNWWTGIDNDGGTAVEIKGGKYILSYNSQNQTGYTTGLYTGYNFYNAQDYAITLTGEIQSKYKSCMWGIIVRGDFYNGYGFMVDNQGNFSLTFNGAKTNDYIGNIKIGSNSAIKWDEPNTITALVEGKNMTFYVNGEPIISHEAENTTSQEISWTVWAAEGVTATFEFDDLLVREK